MGMLFLPAHVGGIVRAEMAMRTRAHHQLTYRRPCLRFLSSIAGAEFWSAFFFTGTIAIPILLYSTEQIVASSLVLGLLGIVITVLSVCFAAFLQARAESDAYSAW